MGKLWTILTHLHSLAGYVQFIFTAADFLHFFYIVLSCFCFQLLVNSVVIECENHLLFVCSCRPTVMLLYPLYASVQAMESPSKLDDEQWLAYWILYSFITLMEMVLESLIYW